MNTMHHLSTHWRSPVRVRISMFVCLFLGLSVCLPACLFA